MVALVGPGDAFARHRQSQSGIAESVGHAQDYEQPVMGARSVGEDLRELPLTGQASPAWKTIRYVWQRRLKR
jgi:hypothetical protein